jgi:hypothetical protein
MRHIELHTVDNERDVAAAVSSGLLDDYFPLTVCAACSDGVGSSAADANFVPYVICLDDDSRWYLCDECAADVLEPNFALDDDNLLFDDEDYEDDFRLLDD